VQQGYSLQNRMNWLVRSKKISLIILLLAESQSPLPSSFFIILILAKVTKFLALTKSLTKILKVSHLKKFWNNELPQKALRSSIFLQTHIFKLWNKQEGGQKLNSSGNIREKCLQTITGMCFTECLIVIHPLMFI